MAEPVVVQDNLSDHGLRTIHVMQEGERPDAMMHLAKVPGEGRDSLETLVLRDKDLKGIWHVWLYWNVRERVVVDLKNLGGGIMEGVMWHVGKGERYSTEIRNAALYYLVEFDCWPEVAFLLDLKAGAPLVVEWDGDLQIGKVRVRIEGARWMPRGCVFVTKEMK